MRGKRDMLVDLRIRDRNGAGNEACNEVEWRLFRDCHNDGIMAFRAFSPCSCFFVSVGLQFNLQTLTYRFLSRTTHAGLPLVARRLLSFSALRWAYPGIDFAINQHFWPAPDGH